MSRKQRSLARKMHNKLYLNEALLDGTSVLKVFRTHYKAHKSNFNNLEAYYRRLYIKLKKKWKSTKKSIRRNKKS